MHSDLFANVRVVLVGTTHPGNIGAVARAMKTMRLHRLYLVQPARFPSADATARAAGADDILYDAVVAEDLEAAVAGCVLVAGASARRRSVAWPETDPSRLAREVAAWAGRGEVALVFGREHSGLTNAELDRCQLLVRIPTAPGYRSLNLAGAVQVIAYELLLACRGAVIDAPQSAVAAPVPAAELEAFFQHLESVLTEIGYFDPQKPRKLMRRLRRMFYRMRPDRAELNILRGILSAAQQASRRGRD